MNILVIDPDCDKSGVAVLDTETKKFLKLDSLSFCELLVMLQSIKFGAVYIEAGWLYGNNWHVNSNMNARISAKIGNKTGRNHETGRKLFEIAKFYGQKVTLSAPLRKVWNGAEGKISAEEFRQVTGYEKRTNQDVRDAGLIAWVRSGLPVRVLKKS